MSGDSSIVAKGDISANVFNSIDLGGACLKVLGIQMTIIIADNDSLRLI